MRTDIYCRDLGKYIKERHDMLVQDFKIFLSEEEIAYLHGLATEISVDNFVHDIIRKKVYEVGKGKNLKLVTKAEYDAIVASRPTKKRKKGAKK